MPRMESGDAESNKMDMIADNATLYFIDTVPGRSARVTAYRGKVSGTTAKSPLQFWNRMKVGWTDRRRFRRDPAFTPGSLADLPESAGRNA